MAAGREDCQLHGVVEGGAAHRRELPRHEDRLCASRPGGALNTYYSESLWGRVWRQNWYILVLNTSQIWSAKTLMRTLSEHGFEIVSRRRDRPYTSLKYLLFQLARHIPGAVRNSVFERLSFAPRFVFRVPLPDVYEYICVKRRDLA